MSSEENNYTGVMKAPTINGANMNNILSMQDIVKTYYKGDEDLEKIKHINFLVDEIVKVSE